MSLIDSHIVCLASAMVSLVTEKTFCTESYAGSLLSSLLNVVFPQGSGTGPSFFLSTLTLLKILSRHIVNTMY